MRCRPRQAPWLPFWVPLEALLCHLEVAKSEYVLQVRQRISRLAFSVAASHSTLMCLEMICSLRRRESVILSEVLEQSLRRKWTLVSFYIADRTAWWAVVGLTPKSGTCRWLAKAFSVADFVQFFTSLQLLTVLTHPNSPSLRCRSSQYAC